MKNKFWRGWPPVAKILVVAVVLIGIGLAAFYFLFQPKPDSTTLAHLSPLNSSCSYHDARLCNFVNRFSRVNNYTATSTQTTPKNDKSVMVLKLAATDKYQLVSQLNNHESYNSIILGKSAYILDYTDHKWWKQSLDNGEAATAKHDFDSFSSDTAYTPSQTQYKFVRKEKCGNLICYKYQVLSSGQDPFQAYIWFDDKDFLLRKSITQAPGGALVSYDYDYKSVNVSTPEDIKKLRTGEFPTGTLNGTPTPTTTTTNSTPPGDGMDSN